MGFDFTNGPDDNIGVNEFGGKFPANGRGQDDFFLMRKGFSYDDKQIIIAALARTAASAGAEQQAFFIVYFRQRRPDGLFCVCVKHQAISIHCTFSSEIAMGPILHQPDSSAVFILNHHYIGAKGVFSDKRLSNYSKTK
jgi:hypothetical protein